MTTDPLHFQNSDDAPSSLNNIKDMLAGLPKYQQGKEAFALHLGMTSDAMELFVQRRLADYASVEQVRDPSRCDQLIQMLTHIVAGHWA